MFQQKIQNKYFIVMSTSPSTREGTNIDEDIKERAQESINHGTNMNIKTVKQI